MSSDPYQTLGVKRDATEADIRKAYRRQAKQLHPDLNPGDKAAEAKFKTLNAANDILSDPEKRAKFDRGEIDASGNERPRQPYYRDFEEAESGERNPYRSAAGFSDIGDAGDIFAEFFSSRAGVRGRGSDVRYRLTVDFLEAVNGATKHLSFDNGTPLDVVIPPGTRDGQRLRLAGKGQPGREGDQPGDAFIEIAVRPHPFFVRDGDDIRLDLPISLPEAVLGGKVRVPTPKGNVMATIPQWSSSGKVLRLKGRGVPRSSGVRGDEYVTLRIVLPDTPDPALQKFVTDWQAGKAHDPRRAMGA